MNKDQVEGKLKDVAGRVERQAGEWTGSKDTEVKGAAKQVEGKVQGAYGDAKDAVNKAADEDKKNQERAEKEKIRSERKASWFLILRLAEPFSPAVNQHRPMRSRLCRGSKEGSRVTRLLDAGTVEPSSRIFPSIAL